MERVTFFPIRFGGKGLVGWGEVNSGLHHFGGGVGGTGRGSRGGVWYFIWGGLFLGRGEEGCLQEGGI